MPGLGLPPGALDPTWEGIAAAGEGAEMASIGAMAASYALYLAVLEGSLNAGFMAGAAIDSLWDMANSPVSSGMGGVPCR